MDSNADSGGRTVTGNLGNRLGTVGAELIVHINEDRLEILRSLVDHGCAVIGKIGVDALAVFIQLHILIQRMSDGLHHRTVHLAQGNLRIDGRTGILQGIELLHLNFTGLHIHRHLGKVRAVGHGGCVGDKAAMGNHLAASRAAGGGMHQVIVRECSAGILGVHLAGGPDIQVLHLLLHLQGGLLQD